MESGNDKRRIRLGRYSPVECLLHTRNILAHVAERSGVPTPVQVLNQRPMTNADAEYEPAISSFR
jgi:hypothetical protein